MSQNIAENLGAVLSAIRQAERAAGRPEGSVRLLAVSKFHPAAAVVSAIRAGQLLFGENRVQEAHSKFAPLLAEFPQAELHIIGQLQRNKVRKAAEIASCIESVDRIELIEELEKQCARLGKTVRILFEYHTGEASKSGFLSSDALAQAAAYCGSGAAPHVIPAGFMTMAPFTDDRAAVRNSFRTMRKTAEEIRRRFPQMSLETLSMGMSNDFVTAVEEGSTEVRIGTAIFGEREAFGNEEAL